VTAGGPRRDPATEFKEQFDVKADRDWCEIIKDIVAIANSGGGFLLIGLRSDGTPSGSDVTEALKLDPAKLTDKVFSYTGEQFGEFEMSSLRRGRKMVAALQIGEASTPMIFTNPGTYTDGSKKPVTAFARGTLYFRHGAKSEPATSNDLRKVIEREIRRDRKSLTRNMRRVVEAPRGAQVHILPAEVKESSSPTATPIRLTDDPSAPAYRRVQVDDDYPYRQTEVLGQVNQRLAGKISINAHHIFSVRKVFGIDKDHRYCHRLKFSSPQYSEAFVGWLVTRYEANQHFFLKSRADFKAGKRG
jgi:hypothetical protein